MKEAIKIFALFTLLTGVIYPLGVTTLAQGLFHNKANGSLIMREGKTIGSELIAQRFHSARYFWGRPSAGNYIANPPSASNLGPISRQLKENALINANIYGTDILTPELLTTSGSGLDPHVSLKSIIMQIPRISLSRSIPREKLEELVKSHVEARMFNLLGQERINVVKLNMALDGEKL